MHFSNWYFLFLCSLYIVVVLGTLEKLRNELSAYPLYPSNFLFVLPFEFINLVSIWFEIEGLRGSLWNYCQHSLFPYLLCKPNMYWEVCTWTTWFENNHLMHILLSRMRLVLYVNSFWYMPWRYVEQLKLEILDFILILCLELLLFWHSGDLFDL
jgi:hypothetical protein